MSLFRRAANLSAIEQIIADRVGLGRSGVANVSRPTAMRHSAVWAALRLRADLISTMPVDTFRKVDGVQVETPRPPVLVNPGVAVSTPAVYRALDDGKAFGDVAPPPMPAAFESVEEFAAWLGMMRNDLQDPAIALAPEIGDVVETLADEPETLLARMSGSGATCFAICASDIEAEALAERIASMRPGWWVRRCRLGGPWPD